MPFGSIVAVDPRALEAVSRDFEVMGAASLAPRPPPGRSGRRTGEPGKAVPLSAERVPWSSVEKGAHC